MENFEMKSEYICPKCGGNVEYLIHPTYPPQSHYRCLKCGEHRDIRHDLPPQKYAPFNLTHHSEGK